MILLEYFIGFALALIIIPLWKWFCDPQRETEFARNLGFGAARGKQKGVKLNRLKKFRPTEGNLPPYPNGWYVYSRSDQLKFGKSLDIFALGKNLIAWRDSNGKAQLAERCCSNMALLHDDVSCDDHRGKIKEMHEDAKNLSLEKNSDQKSEIKTFRTFEKNILLYFWYHAEGIEPNWTPLEHINETKGPMVLRRSVAIPFYNHPELLTENAVDQYHFEDVHTISILKYDALSELPSEEFSEDQWELINSENIHPERHIYRSSAKALKTLLGLPVVNFVQEYTQEGPCFATYYLFVGYFKLRVVFVVSSLPVKPGHTTLNFHLYTNAWLPNIFVVLIHRILIFEVSGDARVWNRAIFSKRPCLPSEDWKIKAYRLWYSQFFSANSVRA